VIPPRRPCLGEQPVGQPAGDALQRVVDAGLAAAGDDLHARWPTPLGDCTQHAARGEDEARLLALEIDEGCGEVTEPVVGLPAAVEGHAALAAQFDTPIATGEMLTSAAEHGELIRHRAADYLMPDGPRVGGITPFLKVATLAQHAGLMLAPHFAMELHVHLAATYPTEPWLEHFEWLEPLFNERLELADGRMLVPTRPGLGISLSEQARAWTRELVEIGKRP